MERDQYSAYVLELVDQKSEITNVDLLELNRLQTLLSVAADDAKNILERVSEPEFRAVVSFLRPSNWKDHDASLSR